MVRARRRAPAVGRSAAPALLRWFRRATPGCRRASGPDGDGRRGGSCTAPHDLVQAASVHRTLEELPGRGAVSRSARPRGCGRVARWRGSGARLAEGNGGGSAAGLPQRLDEGRAAAGWGSVRAGADAIVVQLDAGIDVAPGLLQAPHHPPGGEALGGKVGDRSRASGSSTARTEPISRSSSVASEADPEPAADSASRMPSRARRIRASRTGVRLTPSCFAMSVSRMRLPGVTDSALNALQEIEDRPDL